MIYKDRNCKAMGDYSIEDEDDIINPYGPRYGIDCVLCGLELIDHPINGCKGVKSSKDIQEDK
jgi:hypothetical protein